MAAKARQSRLALFTRLTDHPVLPAASESEKDWLVNGRYDD